MINAVVWNENIHERENETVAQVYPTGIHGYLAQALNADPGIQATTATLDQPEHGLSVDRLAQTDVLLWWGHAGHGQVDDAIVQRVADAVYGGMGLILLHSAHFAKIFLQLMGTPCNLSWREAGERERLWVTAPYHPIAQGIGPFIELENEEMYGEPFGVPEPMETVFVSWFQGGEVFRSGLTYQRGGGKIFYFRPGHETYPTFHNETVQTVLRNAVHWAHNPAPRTSNVHDAPNAPVETALEPISARGPKLHQDGETGFR